MANTYVTGVDGFNAATPNYNALVNKLYDWSNRDIQALPPQIARDCLHYAADNAYRVLRIPPLEHTVVYDNTNDRLINASTGLGNIYQSVTAIEVPPDLIEFIHIRGRDENMLTTRVFNEKADVRSYWDFNTNHYNQTAFWSRQGNSVLLTPAFGRIARGFYGGVGGAETEIEMYYYRRLPDLQAQYEQSYNNWAGGAGTLTLDGVDTPYVAQTEAEYNALLAAATSIVWVGNEVPNWLKDENEKIVLMGGLGEAFSYLQEDDQSQKYFDFFKQELTDLNDENRQRDTAGGNIQIQYNARGML